MEEKLTREKAVKLFREHWRNLGKSGSMVKRINLPAEYQGQFIMNNCFLCEYACHEFDKSGSEVFHFCRLCPIKWPKAKTTTYMCEDSLYLEWTREWETDKRKKLAKQISRLPEKK